MLMGTQGLQPRFMRRIRLALCAAARALHAWVDTAIVARLLSVTWICVTMQTDSFSSLAASAQPKSKRDRGYMSWWLTSEHILDPVLEQRQLCLPSCEARRVRLIS